MAYYISFSLTLLMLAGLAVFVFISGADVRGWDLMRWYQIVMDQGVKAGVSMKDFGMGILKADSYPWTNQMPLW